MIVPLSLISPYGLECAPLLTRLACLRDADYGLVVAVHADVATGAEASRMMRRSLFNASHVSASVYKLASLPFDTQFLQIGLQGFEGYFA